MPRIKKPALIISFEKTTDAMAVEKYCMSKNLPGRIIPVPREITAGCGLAWKADPSDREALINSLDNDGLAYGKVYELEI